MVLSIIISCCYDGGDVRNYNKKIWVFLLMTKEMKLWHNSEDAEDNHDDDNVQRVVSTGISRFPLSKLYWLT